MDKAIILRFSLDSDISNLINHYEEHLSYLDYMIEKLKSNSYKSDNTKELINYSMDKDHIEYALEKLKEFRSTY